MLYMFHIGRGIWETVNNWNRKFLSRPASEFRENLRGSQIQTDFLPLHGFSAISSGVLRLPVQWAFCLVVEFFRLGYTVYYLEISCYLARANL